MKVNFIQQGEIYAKRVWFFKISKKSLYQKIEKTDHYTIGEWYNTIFQRTRFRNWYPVPKTYKYLSSRLCRKGAKTKYFLEFYLAHLNPKHQFADTYIHSNFLQLAGPKVPIIYMILHLLPTNHLITCPVPVRRSDVSTYEDGTPYMPIYPSECVGNTLSGVYWHPLIET